MMLRAVVNTLRVGASCDSSSLVTDGQSVSTSGVVGRFERLEGGPTLGDQLDGRGSDPAASAMLAPISSWS